MKWDGPLTILANQSVLIVEDQFLIAEEMRIMVERLGGQAAGPVADLTSARQILESQVVDFALLDVNLGPDDAYSLARELTSKNIRYVFTTGYGHGSVPSDLQSSIYLQKPVTTRTLAEALTRLPPREGR